MATQNEIWEDAEGEPGSGLARALQDCGIDITDDLVCRVYRRKGAGVTTAEEWTITYTGEIPEIERLAEDRGPGVYRLKVNAKKPDGSTVSKAAIVRVSEDIAPQQIAQSAQVSAPAAVVPTLRERLEEVRELFSMLREFMPTQAAAAQPVPLMPDIMGEMGKQMSRIAGEYSKMQLDFMKQQHDFRMNQLQDEYDDEDDDDEEEDGEEFDIVSMGPVIAQYLPQLLGPAGGALVPLVRSLPAFQQIKNNVEILGSILDGIEVSTGDKIRLIKMLGLPGELIPAEVIG